jgi:hypothetical protein
MLDPSYYYSVHFPVYYTSNYEKEIMYSRPFTNEEYVFEDSGRVSRYKKSRKKESFELDREPLLRSSRSNSQSSIDSSVIPIENISKKVFVGDSFTMKTTSANPLYPDLKLGYNGNILYRSLSADFDYTSRKDSAKREAVEQSGLINAGKIDGKSDLTNEINCSLSHQEQFKKPRKRLRDKIRMMVRRIKDYFA